MATVFIQKRKLKNPKGKMSYRVLYKDPLTFKNKHYKTLYKYKEAQRAAHNLRELIDNHKFSEIKRTKRMIGHKDISMTDRYSHLSALHKKALQERLAEWYGKVV